MRLPLAISVLLAVLLIVTCGGDDEGNFQRPEEGGEYDIVPLVMTTQQVQGANRFAFQLLDPQSQNVADATVSLRTAFLDAGGDEAVLGEPVDAVYQALESEELGSEVEHEHPDGSIHAASQPFGSGIYVANLDFDRPGNWGLEFSIDSDVGDEDVPLVVSVLEDGSTPGPGDPAPATENYTLDDRPIEELSSDVDPDLSFYRTTVAETLAAGEPFLVAFATPAYCHSRICGPVLDQVKEVMGDHPGVTFIHIEPFENLTDPENLVDSPFVAEWGLPNEPWTFLVDDEGIVRAALEGPFRTEELQEALCLIDDC